MAEDLDKVIADLSETMKKVGRLRREVVRLVETGTDALNAKSTEVEAVLGDRATYGNRSSFVVNADCATDNLREVIADLSAMRVYARAVKAQEDEANAILKTRRSYLRAQLS